MPLRTRLFIIISIIVLFVLGVSVFLLLSARKKSAVPAGATGGEATPTAGSNVIDSSNFDQSKLPGATSAIAPAPTTMPSQPATALEIEQNAAKQIAKIFVERYNTFSTDNNLQNIREVEELVTPTLWKKLSMRLTSATAPASPYMVVTTQAMSTAIATWQDTVAQVVIQARKTTDRNGTTTTAEETITVAMVKQGNNWLVDNFTAPTP